MFSAYGFCVMLQCNTTVTCGVDQGMGIVWMAGSNFLIPPITMALSVLIWRYESQGTYGMIPPSHRDNCTKQETGLSKSQSRSPSIFKRMKRGTIIPCVPHPERISLMCRFNGYFVWIHHPAGHYNYGLEFSKCLGGHWTRGRGLPPQSDRHGVDQPSF